MKCALNAMPACLPRSSDFRVLLRVFDRLATQILAVELERSKAQDPPPGWAGTPRMQVEHRKAFIVGDYRLAVDEAGACRERRDRRHGKGKRPAKLWPLRVCRVTPLASRSARMRKPSCLIS